MRYVIVVQPADDSGDHWLEVPVAASADKFAKWIHKATGAAVSVYDARTDTERMALGAFNHERV